MSAKVARALPVTPRKPLAMGFALRLPASEPDHKALVEQAKTAVGLAIEIALDAAQITKKEASDRMGYGTNQAPLSNWIAGKETPQFAKLWGHLGDRFRQELVIALAGQCTVGVEVETVVTLTRRRA